MMSFVYYRRGVGIGGISTSRLGSSSSKRGSVPTDESPSANNTDDSVDGDETLQTT